MNNEARLSSLETTVAQLLQDLGNVAKEPAVAGQNEYAARPPYRRPDEKIHSIVDALEKHETTIRRLLANETQDLQSTSRFSRRLGQAPSTAIASGVMVSQGQIDKCRKLLDDIANGLASIGSSKAPYNAATSYLRDVGDVYRDPRASHPDYQSAPSVLYETLRRLHPPQSDDAAGRVPPTPGLGGTRSTQRVTLTDKLLFGHGTIKIPMGYLALRPDEPDLPNSNLSLAPYRRTHDPSDEYGNCYQKPLYAHKKVKLWY